MTPLRRFSITVAPFLVSGACAQLIGLSDYEKGEVTGAAGDGEDGGEGGDGGTKGGNGGTAGSQMGGSAGRGGSRTGGRGGTLAGGEGGDSGDAGMGGEPQGGTGMGGAAPRGGTAGGGMGGMGGSAGGGTGGIAGGVNCNSVSVPLVSANFDQDTSVWIPYSDGSAIPIIAAAPSLGITADTPPNVAHLAGAHSQYSGHFQSFTIPAGTLTLTMTGYRQVVTEEDPKSESVFDDMAIQMWEDALNPTTDTRVGEFAYYSNLDPTNGWTMFTSTVAVTAYAGQTVDLDMWGYSDDTLLTHFYIDSLALSALVCQ